MWPCHLFRLGLLMRDFSDSGPNHGIIATQYWLIMKYVPIWRPLLPQWLNLTIVNWWFNSENWKTLSVTKCVKLAPTDEQFYSCKDVYCNCEDGEVLISIRSWPSWLILSTITNKSLVAEKLWRHLKSGWLFGRLAYLRESLNIVWMIKIGRLIGGTIVIAHLWKELKWLWKVL